MEQQELVYGGFWIRVGAALIDTLLLSLVIAPILTAIYGQEYWIQQDFLYGTWDLLLNYLFPAVAVMIFWIYKSATPGKMVLKLRIVDANTGGKPSNGQLVVRYLGYYVSTIPFLLGLIWVGIDKRKQGWHDKLANTVVVREQRSATVTFDKEAL